MTVRVRCPRPHVAAFALVFGAFASPAMAQPRPPARPAQPARPGRPPARPAQPAANAPAANVPAAAAQPAPEDAQLLEARRAYDEGTAHFNAGRYAEALTSFTRAHELRPNHVVLLPILESHERLGHVPEAIAVLERYLREAPPSVDRAPLEARLAALRTRPGRVTVTTDPPGASVTLDDRPVGGPTPTEVEVPPGGHILRAALRGRQTAERSLDLGPGVRETVTLALAASPAADPITAPPVIPAPIEQPRRGTSPVVWVAAGLGGVGLVVGTVFGVMALSDANEYDQMPTRETLDRGERNAILSDVGFLTAIAGTAVAVIVYASGRSRADSAPPAAASTATGAASLRLMPNGLSLRF